MIEAFEHLVRGRGGFPGAVALGYTSAVKARRQAFISLFWGSLFAIVNTGISNVWGSLAKLAPTAFSQ